MYIHLLGKVNKNEWNVDFVLSKKCNYALFLNKISFYIIFFVSLHTERINKSFIDLLKWDNYKTDIRRIESLKNS